MAASRPSRNKRVPGAGLWRTTTDPIKPQNRRRADVDILPRALPAPPPSVLDSISAVNANTQLGQFRNIDTPRSVFGLWRRFFAKAPPSHDPEELATLEDLSDIVEPLSSPCVQETSFSPYPNKSSFLLGDWYWNGGTQKSQQAFNRLINIIGDPEFRPEDVRRTPWKSIDAQLAGATYRKADKDEEWLDAGWKSKEIKVLVPFPKHARNPGVHEYTVGTLWYRSILDVIREKFSNPHSSRHYHYDPFELFWSSWEGDPGTRVHGELYTSPAFLDEHRKIQELPSKSDWREFPRHVVALMFASDVTHLTLFGTAHLWPCYMYFGNESKYRRSQPSCETCSHIAYFQKVLSYCLCPATCKLTDVLTSAKLPDGFKDFLTTHMGPKKDMKDLISHVCREALHAQWSILLDDKFIEAWLNGIPIEGPDGITRLFFPRIFAYSADYPEK
jgi:Plavaka transposase